MVASWRHVFLAVRLICDLIVFLDGDRLAGEELLGLSSDAAIGFELADAAFLADWCFDGDDRPVEQIADERALFDRGGDALRQRLGVVTHGHVCKVWTVFGHVPVNCVDLLADHGEHHVHPMHHAGEEPLISAIETLDARRSATRAALGQVHGRVL